MAPGQPGHRTSLSPAVLVRLAHLGGLIDDARYTTSLRKRIDELTGSELQLLPGLAGARNLAVVVEVVRRLDEQLRLGLSACDACVPAVAGGHVERAETSVTELERYALAVQELATARHAIDGALQSANLTSYRSLPTFHGLYRAVATGDRLLADGAPARALGVAQGVQRELAILFERQSGASHTCHACCGDVRSQLGDEAACVDALRDSAHRELASRLACDIAARRARRPRHDEPAGGSAAAQPPGPEDLVRRSGRVADQARTHAAALRAMRMMTARTAGEEKDP